MRFLISFDSTLASSEHNPPSVVTRHVRISSRPQHQGANTRQQNRSYNQWRPWLLPSRRRAAYRTKASTKEGCTSTSAKQQPQRWTTQAKQSPRPRTFQGLEQHPYLQSLVLTTIAWAGSWLLSQRPTNAALLIFLANGAGMSSKIFLDFITPNIQLQTRSSSSRENNYPATGLQKCPAAPAKQLHKLTLVDSILKKLSNELITPWIISAS